MSIIKAENITLMYGAGTSFEKTALDNVSFEIEKGEFTGIIGHTGSGKSTLVQLLNGLMKPDKGCIYLDEKNIWKKPKQIRNVRFRVGLVFQYPEHQLFEETVYKDIAFGPKNMGLEEDEIDRRVRQASEFAGLKEDKLMLSPFDLSGGEKRRAAIAGVIAMDPEVLILDEPTAGLDPLGRDALLSGIEDYHRSRNKTIILVSHNMEDVARYCEKVLVMSHGKKILHDTTESVFTRSDILEQNGLRVPQIMKVMSELKQKGINVDTSIMTVDKAFIEIINLLSDK